MKQLTFLALTLGTAMLCVPITGSAAPLGTSWTVLAQLGVIHHDVEDCVDGVTWKITANGAPSGRWVFNRDGSVLGIDLSGRTAWTGTWQRLGRHRYSFRFDYQGTYNNMQYVQFSESPGGGCADTMLGYSDAEMRYQNREGRMGSAAR
jgi:hypothetical protein